MATGMRNLYSYSPVRSQKTKNRRCFSAINCNAFWPKIKFSPTWSWSVKVSLGLGMSNCHLSWSSHTHGFFSYFLTNWNLFFDPSLTHDKPMTNRDKPWGQFACLVVSTWKIVVKNGASSSPIFGVNMKNIPSRELTYPTLGKGKSSSKCHFGGIC